MEHRQYKKNDIVTVAIEDIGNDGEGIGKSDGYTLFVKDAVIGDTVEARITKCKKNYGYARVEKVVTPSSFRVEPKCRFHRQCGGCQIQAMSYERQLAYKKDKIRNNLIHIGGFPAELIDEITESVVGMEEPWHYRNKAQFPVGYDKNGNLIAGFYAGRTHDIIANTDCALGAPENHAILEAVLDYMREMRVSAYRETDGTGMVRHVLIRTGFASGEIMVCLVINGRSLPAEDRLVEKLRGAVPEEISAAAEGSGQDADHINTVKSKNHIEDEIKPDKKKAAGQDISRRRIVSISVSVNTQRTNVIMGKEIRVLWGSGTIKDSIRILDPGDFENAGHFKNPGHPGNPEQLISTESPKDCMCRKEHKDLDDGRERITFIISPLSFYQVNPLQTERLYSLALEYAGLTGKETVWDLYCGIGTISLFMAKRAKKVYGVEVVPQAVEDARENAGINGIKNVEFYEGKAEEVLPEFYGSRLSETYSVFDEEKRHPDVIVVDPPRKGCDEKCLETMLAMQPERIVYVSCDSATLARDLKVLCGGGYELKRVRGVDQFGGTVHVETVCLLSKLHADQYIEVELQMDEFDLTVAESKATYEEIKEYVLEHSGLKVSNLYIAQVKRKYGIIERVNCNLPKTEDSRQPNCPLEKERAIREALKYFRMI